MSEAQTEHNRLLEKAETLVFLSEFDEAESIYRYIIADAPEEWRAYVGLAKTLIFKVNEPVWSYDALCNFKYMAVFSDVFECERKAILLEPKSKALFEELWNKYQERHLEWKKQQEETRKENNRKAELAQQNAQKFMELVKKNGKEIKLDNLCELIDPCKSNIKFFKSKFYPFNKEKYGLDYEEYEFNYYENEDDCFYHISEIISIDNVNIRVNCKSASKYGKSQFLLVLDNEYSIEELYEAICEMQSPHEIAEKRRANNLCVLCGSTLNINEFCSNCSHLNMNLIQKKQKEILNIINIFSDRVNVLNELKEKFATDFKISDCRVDHRIFGILCADAIIIGKHKTMIRYKTKSESVRYLTFDVETKKLSEIIDYLKNRKTSNVCQYCGGTFKGLFKLKCSKCRKEKDY